MFGLRFGHQKLRLASRQASRNAAFSAYVGQGVALCRVLAKYKMYVPVRDLSITPHLILDGSWEYWVTRAIAQHLQPGMCVADVGANVGYFSILMADRVGETGHVHAFEPNPELTELLGRTAAINGFTARLSIHDRAVSDVDDAEAILAIPGNYLGGSAIQNRGEEPGWGERVTKTCRLDSVAGMSDVSLIKIDAEGAEPAIWDGMMGLLSGAALKTVLIEFTAGHYADPMGFIRKLIAPGFSMSLIDEKRGSIPVTPDELLSLPAHIGPMLVLTR